MKSHALTPEEAEEFRNNVTIAHNLITSYELILDFYGMELKDKQTGELARSQNFQSRYHMTLLTSFHNHLRVTRILAHLYAVGFRRYGKQLAEFLRREIFGHGQSALKEDAPMQKLQQCQVYQTYWSPFNVEPTEENVKRLSEICHCTPADMLKDSVYFTP